MAGADPRVVFLCSGGGGNMRFLHRAGARIAACVTDRDCAAQDYATAHGIPTHRADFSVPGQDQLVAMLADKAPDIIVTNVHRILHAAMLQHFAPQLVNLHYSLLPNYAGTIGTAPVQQAIDAGDSHTGVTLHRVTETLDGGPQLLQVAVPLHAHDTLASVMDTVFRAGCLTLWHYWRYGGSKAGQAMLPINGRSCMFDRWQAPANPFPDDAPIWSQICEGA